LLAVCREYRDGTINDAQFQNRVRNDIAPMVAAATGTTDAIATFLQETGNRADVEKMGLLDRLKAHRAGLINLDLDSVRLNMRLGVARNVDVKTEVKSTSWADRFSRWTMEGLQRNRFLGRIINPTTVGVAAYGVTNIIATAATSTGVRVAGGAALGVAAGVLLAPTAATAALAIGVGALSGAAIAALRSNKEILRLKAQKEKRDALSYNRADDQKGIPSLSSRVERRMEAQNALYDKAPVGTLIGNINAARANYANLVQAVAEARVRNEMSEMGVSPTEQERVDLIKWAPTAEATVERQRMRLVRTIAEGQENLRNIATNTQDPDADVATAMAAARANIIGNMRGAEARFLTTRGTRGR